MDDPVEQTNTSGATLAQKNIRLAEFGAIQQPQSAQDIAWVDADTRISPPPLPRKTEGDRTFRGTASRPMSLITESNYEPASSSRVGPPTVRGATSRPMLPTQESNDEPGLENGSPLPREPIQRSSMIVVQSQAPSMTCRRERRTSFRINSPPPDQLGPPYARRQSTATLDWKVPENEKVVVSNTTYFRASSSVLIFLAAGAHNCGRTSTADP